MRQLSIRDLAAHRLGQFDLQVPEDLTALDREDIDRLRAEATAEFDRLDAEVDKNGGIPTAEQLDAMTRLRDSIIGLMGEGERRDTEEAGRRDAAAELRDSIPKPAEAEETDTDDAEGEEAETEGAEAETDTEEAPAAVVAGGGRPSLKAAAKHAPKQARAKAAGRAVILASAGNDNVENGAEIDRITLAKMFDNRAQGYRHMRGQAGYAKSSVGRVKLPFEAALIASGASGEDDMKVLDHAADHARLPGGSLIAAGGWCAPSETIYDIPGDGASRDGLFDTPEIGAPRGGIKYNLGADFTAVYATGLQVLTEAHSIAQDQDKTCVTVPCPDWVEARLDAIPFCVTGDILQNHAYPEQQASFIDESLIAQAHLLSKSKLARVIAGSTSPGTVAQTSEPNARLLGQIEIQVEDIKYRRRIARTEVLEVVLPFWIMGVLRQNVAVYAGLVDPFDVTDAMIMKWFTDRNIAVQFVYDWQDGLDAVSGAPGHSGTTYITAWPTSVQFLIYRAGTWVAGVEDVINISALYDSTLLKKNQYVALFTETGLFMAQRLRDSRIVTVPLGPSS